MLNERYLNYIPLLLLNIMVLLYTPPPVRGKQRKTFPSPDFSSLLPARKTRHLDRESGTRCTGNLFKSLNV